MTAPDILQKTILDEYKVWRKNVPYNYDLLVTHSLPWPSLTCQFFPTCVRASNATTQNMLLSTHTSSKETEYIKIISLTLPDEITDAALEKFQASLDNYGDSKVKVEQEIPVKHEINRARYCPFAINVIAARSDSPTVHVFDTTKHLSSSTSVVDADVNLVGNGDGGYGLCWSSIKNGYLASAGNDGSLCVFDINKDIGSKTTQAILKLSPHDTNVGDCTFSPFNNELASVGDDKRIVFTDIRDKNTRVRENAHESDIYCCQYSPIEEFYLLTGSKDGTARVWDQRNMDTALYTLNTNNNEVLQVGWSPHIGSVLALSGTNRRVYIYDISRVGMELTEDEKNDGPPELIFIHGGHTDSVCDFAWNPLEPYEIVSVAEDNIVQVWQMTTANTPFDEDE